MTQLCPMMSEVVDTDARCGNYNYLCKESAGASALLSDELSCTANASGDEFAATIWRLNDQLAARGSWVCPTNCSCDELTACGKPYLNNKTR